MLPTDIAYLGWTLILAIVQILLPGMARTRETGIAYNAGPRDDPGPPVGKITGRLRRAQSNLFETLPLFAAAVLAAHVVGRDGALTATGAAVYFWARVVYLPLYALGVPLVRSLVFLVALAGLVMVIAALMLPR